MAPKFLWFSLVYSVQIRHICKRMDITFNKLIIVELQSQLVVVHLMYDIECNVYYHIDIFIIMLHNLYSFSVYIFFSSIITLTGSYLHPVESHYN